MDQKHKLFLRLFEVMQHQPDASREHVALRKYVWIAPFVRNKLEDQPIFGHDYR